MQTNAVVLDNVSHDYSKVRALDDVSLSISQGISVGLIGPDGVGKSTLLSLIAGSRIIQCGKVSVLGKNQALKSDRENLLKRIAFMPQGLGKNLYATLSVYENIEFHARLFGLPRAAREQRIQRLMTATALDPFATRAAGKLSGGMKQKLSLCCALVHNPELLILDEPTTGVDPLSRRQFWQLVAALRAENPGMTLVVATAYIDEAEQFDQLIAMDNGKILTNLPTQQVLYDTKSDNLEQAYVKLLPKEKQTHWDDSQIPSFQANPSLPYAIEADKLTKRFGNFTAVNEVSFAIAPGEIFGFLGSNGCGKSTTMKMLTGLLDASSGSAKLLGKSIDAKDMSVRQQVGYMSQAFSLYEELSVRQNLVLHAKLYQLSGETARNAIASALAQFELQDLADELPQSLSLGLRQRLQLAAACLHRPTVLILDEPTSGVDPAARDKFWQYLLKLSRDDRVTIFISTHFMNEALRCDRISFMHRGQVLAVGTPAELQKQRQTETLEEAFIAFLTEQQEQPQKQSDSESKTPTGVQTPAIASQNTNSTDKRSQSPNLGFWYWFHTIWTFALRESKELLRDPIRLLFSIFGPIILLLVDSWGLSFDANRINFAVLDQDHSYESREFIEHFSGSPYFKQVAQLNDRNQLMNYLSGEKSRLIIEIPAGFGRRLWLQQKPELAFYIDGSMPFTGENAVIYTTSVIRQYTQNFYQKMGINLQPPYDLQVRMMYNQAFKSVNAISPGLIMLIMMMIPCMMTALGVVREREMGTITNLYGSPASVTQYLLGKQLPYVILALFSYLTLVAITVYFLGVPIKGSFIGLLLGTLLYVLASTAFGLLISTFVKTQIAAIFITALTSVIPALIFSGLLFPMSTITGLGYLVGRAFPTSWYQSMSLGGFTKGLELSSFLPLYGVLALFFIGYMLLATQLLKKQEK